MELQIVTLATKQKKALQRMERYESAVPGTTEWDAVRPKHGCAASTAREMKRLVCATLSQSSLCS